MIAAYILIQTEGGKPAQAARDTMRIAGVTSADSVAGPYDVIARAEERNLDDLAKLVVRRVQEIEGVTRTLTCPVVHL